MIKEILLPLNIEIAKDRLSSLKNSKILAGGTDLMLNISKNNLDIEYLVSLNRINELKQIKEFNYHMVLGSMVTFTDIEEVPSIKENCGCLIDCCKTMGSPQIRNIATIGGNIVNAAPAADIVPCLMTLGAVFIIENRTTMRRFKCEEYFGNLNKLRVRNDEILTQIILMKPKGVSGFYKLGKRNALSISRISASCYLETDKDRVITFKVALGAVGRVSMRLKKVEDLAKNKHIDYLYSEEVIQAVKDTVYESISKRKSAPFKKEAAAGVYKEALNRTLRRLGVRGSKNE